MKQVLIVLVLGVSLAFPALGAPRTAARVLGVVDGTTLTVRIESLPAPSPTGLALGAVTTVRYIGVQAPAKPEEAALVRELNVILVEGKQVFLEVDAKVWDEAGRLLAYVYLDKDGKLMVNAILVATDLVGFAPVPGANRYDHLLSYIDRLPLACPVVYPWSEAGKHLGERACVEGPVASVGTSRAGDVFLNLGKPHPDPGRFTLYIPARHVGKFEAVFGARFWTNLVGRTVRAFGEIKLYQGVPEIQLSDPADLFIVP